MSITESRRFSECLKLAKEAKNLRDTGMKKTAYEVEKQAVCEFRELISDTRNSITEEIEMQKKELEMLKCKSEYLGKVFCIQTGHELSNPIIDLKTTRATGKDGHYLECRLCGWSNKEELFNSSNYFWHRKIAKRIPKYDGNLIKSKVFKSLEDFSGDENVPDWKKTAEEFVKVQKKIEDLSKQLMASKSSLKEICILFGHDAERISDKEDEIYSCTCCGKEMDSADYISDHYEITYKGGIVPYLYWDISNILK